VIAVIDYGAGNLRSVANAIARLGYQPRITGRASDLSEAQAVILPGVGAAGDTMASLRHLFLVSASGCRCSLTAPRKAAGMTAWGLLPAG